MNILCIGNCRYNVELSVDSNNRINDKKESIMGISLVSSYLLSSWEEKVYFEGIVGNDVYGKKIIEELKSVNVNTDYIKTDKKENTEVIFKIKESGKEKILEEINENSNKLLLDYSFIPDIIFSDLSLLEFTKKIIDKYEDPMKIIYVEKFSNEIPYLCKKSDYIIFSISASESITSENINLNDVKSLEKVYNKLSDFYKGVIIIDLKDAGMLYKMNDKIKIMILIKANVNNRNKSIFIGSFVYGISNRLNVEKSLKIATISEYLSNQNNSKSIFIPKLGSVYEIYKKNK